MPGKKDNVPKLSLATAKARNGAGVAKSVRSIRPGSTSGAAVPSPAMSAPRSEQSAGVATDGHSTNEHMGFDWTVPAAALQESDHPERFPGRVRPLMPLLAISGQGSPSRTRSYLLPLTKTQMICLFN